MQPNSEFLQALTFLEKNNLAEAARLLILSLNKNYEFDTLLLLGSIYGQSQKYNLAKKYFLLAKELNPNNLSLTFNLAKLYLDSCDYLISAEYFMKYLEIDNVNLNAKLGLAICFINLNKIDQALRIYEEIEQQQQNIPDVLIGRAEILVRQKKYQDAIFLLNQLLSKNNNFFPALKLLGDIHCQINQLLLAVNFYEEALRLKPDYPEAWSNKGLTLHDLKRYDDALLAYEEALRLKPDYPEAWSNKGLTFFKTSKINESIKCFEHSIQLKNDYPEAFSNLSLCHLENKNFSKALEVINHALEIDPYLAQAWANKGLIQSEMGSVGDAKYAFEQSRLLDPKLNVVLGCIINSKQSLFELENLEDLSNALKDAISKESDYCAPFQLLSITDSNQLIKINASAWSANSFVSKRSLRTINFDSKTIRVAYISPDLREHPVGFLINQLFKLHNRERITVCAVSLQNSDDGIQKIIRQNVDEFHDFSHLHESDLLDTIRRLNFDIAIDLAGFTKGSKTGLFAHGISPVQINFLGYAGTIGSNFMDYLIADQFVIPEEQKKFFSEKIIHLPHFFMPINTEKQIRTRKANREQASLPNNKFIFCNFNNVYKLNSQSLDSWASILRKCKDSVLWLANQNVTVKTKILDQLKFRGIDSNRVIFANRTTTNDEHIDRIGLADLFLDTFPYCAHATAVDCALSGLPILSLCGESFASRVSSSLLHSIGLNELITYSTDEYIKVACEMYSNTEKLDFFRSSLVSQIADSIKFNPSSYAANFDKALINIVHA